MKRNRLTWFMMALFVSASAVVGCSVPDEPTGNDDVPAPVLETEQAPVYEVGVALDGETRTVQARTTDALRAHLLKAGFKGLHGEEAVAAFLTAMVQQTVEETGELPEGVLTVGGHEGDPSALDPSATCQTCYDVYDCTWRSPCNCYQCIYRHTVCRPIC